MKKTFVVSILIFCVLCIVALTGCTAEKTDKVVGTYVLSTKTTQAVDEQTATDYIAINEITEYLVLTGKEKGYRVYKDKNTTLYCTEVKIEYSENDKKKLNSVLIYPDVSDEDDSDLLYVDSKSGGIKLVYVRQGINSSIHSLRYTYTTEYTKISSDVSLKAVEKELGTSLNVVPYELTACHGLCSFDVFEEDKYIYAFAYFDLFGKTAKIYYAEKSDSVQRTLDLALSYDLSAKTLTVGEYQFDFDEHFIARYRNNPEYSVHKLSGNLQEIIDDQLDYFNEQNKSEA